MDSIDLSGNDSAVLSALFDPEASLQSTTRVDPALQGPYQRQTLLQIQAREREALLLLNSENPTDSSIRAATSILNQLVDAYPKYASAWNNRAQARRMLINSEDLLNHPDELSLIMSDLSQAILLASPHTPIDAISPMQAKVLGSAHTHRGYLLWRASRSESPSNVLASVNGLNRIDTEQLEEMASREFAAGGRYGNQVAQQLAVKTNPYAKLCGSIVKEALQKEIADKFWPPIS